MFQQVEGGELKDMTVNYQTFDEFVQSMNNARCIRVDKGIIVFNRKRYTDKRLARYVGKKVLVAIDVDASSVNVFTLGKRYICSAKEVFPNAPY
ncbi:MAG: Mu transposase C-terminal domain-containing protein [bacterium]